MATVSLPDLLLRRRRQFALWRPGVANFSDWGTADPADPASEYVVANWPDAPSGRSWREVTQGRPVRDEWAGREPLYPWEAKVYALS